MSVHFPFPLKRLIVLLIPLFFSTFVHADWQIVGSLENDACAMNLALDSYDVPYAAFWINNSLPPPHGGDIVITKYNGTTWEYVGNPYFAKGGSGVMELVIDSNNTPYITFSNFPNTMVMKFNGITWEQVGTQAPFGNYNDLAFDSHNVPYLAVENQVMKFNESIWENVGGSSFSSGQQVFGVNLVLDKYDTPYVAFFELNPYRISVMKFNGASWEYVGNSGFAMGSLGNLTLDNNNAPYVFFTDNTYSDKASVMRFNGTSWEYVGNPGFSPGSAWGVLALNNNDIYVAFLDGTSAFKSTVMKFDGNHWEYVGKAGFSPGDASGCYIDLVLDSQSKPYVIFRDWASPNKSATIMTNSSESFNCCSYTSVDGSPFCDALLGSYTFEECKALAKSAGAKKFKWGQVNEATAEMCWAGGTCGDVQGYLGVTLDNLTTSILKENLVIQWDTASEESNLGMNLWCAKIQDNQFEEITQLNSELIPSKAILPNYGASYSSTDYSYINTNLKPGIQHCTLEDIDTSGQCTLHCDQIDTVVIGESNKLFDIELNELQAKAIALCNEYKLNGVCLDQLLAPHQLTIKSFNDCGESCPSKW